MRGKRGLHRVRGVPGRVWRHALSARFGRSERSKGHELELAPTHRDRARRHGAYPSRADEIGAVRIAQVLVPLRATFTRSDRESAIQKGDVEDEVWCGRHI